jgi:hypothetical protein
VFTYSSLYQGDVLVLGTTPASPPIPSPLPHGVSTAAKWLQHVRSVNPPSSSASLPSDSIDRSSRNALNSMDACKQNAHTVDERSPLKILSGDGGTAGPEGRNRAVESDHGIDVNKGEKEGEGERGGGGAVLIPAVHGSSSKDKDRDKDIDTNIASAPHTAPALPTATPTPTPTAPTGYHRGVPADSDSPCRRCERHPLQGGKHHHCHPRGRLCREDGTCCRTSSLFISTVIRSFCLLNYFILKF